MTAAEPVELRPVRIFVGETALCTGPLQLGGQPARHVLKVLRMKPGQTLTLFDGRGGEFPATIIAGGRDTLELEVAAETPLSRESPLHTRLAIAIPRGERMDIVVQKATELGVSMISPILTDRSVVRLKGPRAENRRRHWTSVAASACEQCGRNTLPQLEAAQSFTALVLSLGEISQSELRLMPEPTAKKSLPGVQQSIRSVTMLVGPEGGFTQAELDAAREGGFQALDLGPRILRSETAAIGLLTLAQWAWGDMQRSEPG